MPIWSSEIKELEKLYESLKGQLPDLEKELERLIKADDENMILLYSRRCLEVIITDLCECELKRPRKTEPLQGIIDKLKKEEKVPSHIIASMHGLNELSTFGAHPKDFDPEQVKPVLNNLYIIIKWYLKYKGINYKLKEEKLQVSGEPIEGIREESGITVQKKHVKLINRKFLSVVLISSILLIAAIIAVPKIFRRNILERLNSSGERISVAVMPFLNMTNDTTWNVWQDGIQDMLANSLSNSEELKVRQTESINNLILNKGVTNYTSITSSVASSISQKLDANVFIFGNIKQAETTIRVYAQLIDSKTEEVIKSFQIEGSSSKKMIFQIIDSLSSEIKNCLIISKLKNEVTPRDIKTFGYTDSPESYRLFIYGVNAFRKRDYPTAINLFSQSIAIDSNLTAMIFLSLAYCNSDLIEEGKKWCLRIYEIRDIMPMKEKIYTNWLYTLYFETPFQQIRYLRQLLEIDDQLPMVCFVLGNCYSELFQYNHAIPEYEKTLEIYNKWGTKPAWIYNYIYLGVAYHKTGNFRNEIKLYKKAEKDFPNDPNLIRRQSILALSKGKTDAANEYIEQYIAIRKDNSVSEADLASSLGSIFQEAEVLDKAEEYYRQALSSEPDNPERMNTLAYFLIDKDRDVNLGKELIEKALVQNPDNYIYMHTKGLGLLKQAKYEEALEILQKSWDLRMKNSIYDHEAFLHLEAAEKAVAGQM